MPAADEWAAKGGTVSSPATGGEAVTPHDVNDFTNASRAIYVGSAGDVAAVMVNGTVLVFKAVPAGTMLPIRCRRINATNTTATNMVAVN